jgi:cystathionine beta-lyase
VCADNSITLVSPTKTFNIPGLQTSAVIASNQDLRNRAVAGLNRDEIAEPGSFAIEATVAAYTQGEEWLDQMRAYVWQNKELLTSFVAHKLPELVVVKSQATYVSWVDCTGIVEDATQLSQFLRDEVGLVLNPGYMYSEKTKGFVRINLACPKTVLSDGLDRLARGIRAWQSQP